MFFAACMTFQSDTRANVSEEPEGLLFFAALYDFSEDTRANVSEEPRGFNMLVPCSTY